MLQYLTLRGGPRSVGSEEFERDEAVLSHVVGEPDSGKAAETELVNDTVTLVVHLIGEVGGVIAARFVLFEGLNTGYPLVRFLGRFLVVFSGGAGDGRNGEGATAMV